MFEEIEDVDGKTCKISTNNKNTITRNMLDRMLPDSSPFQNPKRRRLNSRSEHEGEVNRCNQERKGNCSWMTTAH